MTEITALQEEDARYLIFRVNKELYGAPLLGIREVIEPQATKTIPNTVSFFNGVINLRGQVVGVIDLRKRFGCAPVDHPRNVVVVFDTEAGPLGALVDEIDGVARIPYGDVETGAVVRSFVPPEFLIGIGKQEGRLVSLIHFHALLGSEELRGMSAIARD